MTSENIKALQEFWDEFESQATFKIKDIKRLQDVLSKVHQQITRLEESRDKWKKKYYEVKK